MNKFLHLCAEQRRDACLEVYQAMQLDAPSVEKGLLLVLGQRRLGSRGKWLIDHHLKIRHSFKKSEVSADQWQTEGQRGRRDPDVIIPDVRTRCLEFASNA